MLAGDHATDIIMQYQSHRPSQFRRESPYYHYYRKVSVETCNGTNTIKANEDLPTAWIAPAFQIHRERGVQMLPLRCHSHETYRMHFMRYGIVRQ